MSNIGDWDSRANAAVARGGSGPGVIVAAQYASEQIGAPLTMHGYTGTSANRMGDVLTWIGELPRKDKKFNYKRLVANNLAEPESKYDDEEVDPEVDKALADLAVEEMEGGGLDFVSAAHSPRFETPMNSSRGPMILGDPSENAVLQGMVAMNVGLGAQTPNFFDNTPVFGGAPTQQYPQQPRQHPQQPQQYPQQPQQHPQQPRQHPQQPQQHPQQPQKHPQQPRQHPQQPQQHPQQPQQYPQQPQQHPQQPRQHPQQPQQHPQQPQQHPQQLPSPEQERQETQQALLDVREMLRGLQDSQQRLQQQQQQQQEQFQQQLQHQQQQQQQQQFHQQQQQQQPWASKQPLSFIPSPARYQQAGGGTDNALFDLSSSPGWGQHPGLRAKHDMNGKSVTYATPPPEYIPGNDRAGSFGPRDYDRHLLSVLLRESKNRDWWLAAEKKEKFLFKVQAAFGALNMRYAPLVYCHLQYTDKTATEDFSFKTLLDSARNYPNMKMYVEDARSGFVDQNLPGVSENTSRQARTHATLLDLDLRYGLGAGQMEGPGPTLTWEGIAATLHRVEVNARALLALKFQLSKTFTKDTAKNKQIWSQIDALTSDMVREDGLNFGKGQVEQARVTAKSRAAEEG
jgi:hypothetical protein